MEKAKTVFAILGLGITIGVVIVVVLIFVVGAMPKSVNVGGVQFEIPTPTVSQYQAPQNNQPVQPPVIPTSISNPVQSNQDSMNCSFIDELVTKADVIQNLYEGQNLAGVQARLVAPIDVPVGWIVQKDGKDYYAPVHFETGTIASFWSPNSCRPLSINK
jgi:Na+-transporting methylmalonyl-CoA/oxaloacetate decarboxylase gamma subunit